MFDIKDIEGLNYVGKNKKKKQIILANTLRNSRDYIVSLKERHIKRYRKIPNYVITREGVQYKLIPDDTYSFFFKKESINKNSIIIVLENLGWLEKRPLTNYYVNWIGDIYKGEIFERKWRDYFFWQPYTDEQIKSCADLCNKLTDNFSIDKKCVGHNTKIDGVEKFEGIASKSNFNSRFTDLSPAFDFDLFIKYFENEQFV